MVINGGYIELRKANEKQYLINEYFKIRRSRLCI